MEGASPVPVALLPRRCVRSAREREVGPAGRRRGVFVLGGDEGRPRCPRGDRRGDGALGRALRRRRLRAHARRDGPRSRARRRRDLAVRPTTHAGASELPPLSVHRAARHRRRLGQVERPLLAARLPRVSRVLLLAAAPRGALDEADRGLRQVGARRRRGVTRPRRRGGTAAVRERGGGTRSHCTRSVPGARRPRRARQLPDARARACGRGAHGRNVRRARRRGPHADGASPREGERPAEGLRRLGRAAGAEGEDVDAGAEPQAARSLRLVADRARPRASRRRDREGAPEAPPGPRDRLARAASGHCGARGRGRADSPGERAARERVGAHRERVGRARPARLPGDQADGRDPGRQLHALPRHRARGELRPLDRRRGLGGRLLPAREPRAEVGGLRLADGLRRLAADGRRRRARGVPDGRLQRRDDRAHRPLPADPRPRRLRRQPRRRRPRLVRARAARGSATGPSSTTTSPAT